MNEQQALDTLRTSENYQVIERLHSVDVYNNGDPENSGLAMVVDTETTGLDTAADKIIELGFVVCRYDSETGAIYDVVFRYDGFEDPCEPLKSIIKELTGIDDAMVKRQKFDDATINAWLDKVDLVIAHNAGFDRKMVERRFPKAATCNWACSLKGINWMNEGIGSGKLDYLAYRFGFFFDGHRAVNDAEATLHLLSMTLPESGQPVMQALLESVNKEYVRLLVKFEYNPDTVVNIKSRGGYQWFPEKTLWHKLIPESELDEELIWLNEQIYAGKEADVTGIPLTARDMFSVREM